MSGQWEVVGKKKDRGSKLPVPKSSNTKEAKNKKNVLNGVKIEEVLPKSQVENLYGSIKKNKENKNPQEKSKDHDNVNKKPQKKEKLQELPKPKPPKSIESALNIINVEEFKSIFETSKNHYPDGPIIWLKELVQFLNQKVPIEVHDPVFTNKPENYPLSVVPSGIKSVIESSINEAGRDNAQLFFDICLSSMATDMSKGLPAVGYKLYLQYIALKEPKLVTMHMVKHVTLRNSYQNRPNIGLSILWAVGHAGHSDIHAGLSVFQECFLPLLDMKNYCRYVVSYLLILVSRKYETALTKEEFLLILDTIYSNKKNFPADLKQQLTIKVVDLKLLLFYNKKEKYYNYVEFLLKKIVMNSNKPYQDCLCNVLLEIFHNDDTTLAIWNKIYSKHITASSLLLDYLVNNWSDASKKLNKTAIVDLLNNFNTVNEELSLKKRKEEGLKEAIASIKELNEKMVSKKKSGFPFKTLSVLIAVSIAGLLYVDVNQHGSWKDSRTSKVLKKYGVCEYTHIALNKTKEGVTWVDSKIEENFPGYHKTVVDFSEPYIQLVCDLGKITRNVLYNFRDIIVEKYPAVIQSIESYAPGVIEQSQNAVSSAYTSSLIYINRSIDYLRKEVFVGQLSPENVQKVVIQAFNTTQQKATEYYHWIYEKVQTGIK